MAISIYKDGIKYGSGQTDSNGNRTFVREIIYSCDADDTDADLLQSEFYPQIGSNCALNNNKYSAFRCDSISTAEHLDGMNGLPSVKCAFRIEATYKLSDSNIAIKRNGKYPWELGVQNFQVSHIETQEPYLFGYDKDGKEKPMLNSAGTKITATIPVYLRQISFDISYKYKGHLHATDDIQYNENALYVSNERIYPYCAKLMPITSNIYTEYKSNGEIDYQYETAHYTIIINTLTWFVSYLDVGTIARFVNSQGEKKLGAIYRYTPWESTDISAKLSTTAKFGSIDDVIIAQKKYWNVCGNKIESIPYEEITEPMPLFNGMLDDEIIQKMLAGDTNIQYHTIERIDRKPVKITIPQQARNTINQ